MAYFETALALHRRVGNRRRVGTVIGQLVRLRGGAGDVSRALSMLDEGEAVLRDVGDPESLAGLLAERAGVLFHGGKNDDARAMLDEARRLVPEGVVATEEVFARVQGLLDGPAV